MVTAISSLPEAGGNLAEYFDLRSEHDMLVRLERLIDDTSYREDREAKIKQSFRPRGWVEIADEIVHRVVDQEGASATLSKLRQKTEPDEIWPLPARIGRYYALSRNSETSISAGIAGGEMYRMGKGWWSPDGWGTWLKREVAELAFTTAEAGNHTHLLYLGLRGAPGNRIEYQAHIVGSSVAEAGILDPEEKRWLVLTIEPDVVKDVIHIHLMTNGRCDLAEATDGEDRRVVTLGVLGFYICREDDLLARHRFIEALQLRRLQSLSGRPRTEWGD